MRSRTSVSTPAMASVSFVGMARYVVRGTPSTLLTAHQDAQYLCPVKSICRGSSLALWNQTLVMGGLQADVGNIFRRCVTVCGVKTSSSLRCTVRTLFCDLGRLLVGVKRVEPSWSVKTGWYCFVCTPAPYLVDRLYTHCAVIFSRMSRCAASVAAVMCLLCSPSPCSQPSARAC